MKRSLYMSPLASNTPETYISRSNMHNQQNLPTPSTMSAAENRVLRSRYLAVKTMPHTQARRNRAFKFLELPVAARELVYKYAILEEHDSKFRYLNESAETNHCIWLYWRNKTPNPSPATSRVCRQMSREALHVYWALPRIYYPYIKQLELPELREMHHFPTRSSPIAPNGIAELREFSVFWSLAISSVSNNTKVVDEHVVKATITVYDLPNATIILETSPKSAETYWDENFMNWLLDLIQARVSCYRLPVSKKGSGRRWTVAEFDTRNVLHTLQAIHYQLWRADDGPTYMATGRM